MDMDFDNIECVSTSDGIEDEEIHHHLKSRGTSAGTAAFVVPPASSVHELLECPVCTNSMYPPIHQVLYKFGFSPKFIDLIRACITTTSFSININGSQEGFITPTRGLRQGCPLSPYLFVLGSEVLSSIILDRISRGSYLGMRLKRDVPLVSHLMFADDLILFGEANTRMMEEIKSIFDLYFSWSGQQVNFEKSSILFSANIAMEERQRLSSLLNVKIMDDKAIYLGNPLFQHRRPLNTYKYLEDKVEKRIGGWKCHLLSHAGREVLIKSSIASIPIYHMGSTCIPVKNIQEMERKMRNFFWGFKEGQRHLYLRAWDFLKLPKINGGLGFRDLKVANLSMIASNAWRFLSNPNSTWAKILKSKYFPSSIWEIQPRSPASPFWRGFMIVRDFLFENTRWLVTKGESIDIFKDKWVANWNDLIARPANWEGSTRVKALLTQDGVWNASLIFQIFDPCTAQRIMATPINRFDHGGKDTLVWLPSPFGNFTAKSFYKSVQNLMVINTSHSSIPPEN